MRRAGRRRLLGALGGATIMLAVYLGAALPVAACDCMGTQPMAAYAGVPENVIFTGTVQAPDANGVPVLVTRWFQGADPAPVVWFAGTFGQGGASCEVPIPPAGTEWIFVAWRGEAGELQINLCTPHAALGTVDGDALLTDAQGTFGDGGAAPAAAEPTAGQTQEPAAPAEPAANTGPSATVLAIGALVTATLVAAVVLIARRGRVGEPG